MEWLYAAGLPRSELDSHSSGVTVPAVNAFSPEPDGSMSPEEEVAYLTHIVYLKVSDSPTPAWLHEHISPTFKADFDNFPSSQTWSELAEVFRLIKRTDPDYQSSILDTTVDVHQQNTHADCFLLIETLGRPRSVRRLSVARLKWRRRDLRWEIYHLLGIRAATFDGM